MKGPVLLMVVIAVSVVSFTAGWVFRDARARGLPRRKAVTWAVLATQEWPLLLLLYRRIRPRWIRSDRPAKPRLEGGIADL